MKKDKPVSSAIHILQYFAATLLPATILLVVGLSYINTLTTDISFSQSKLAILPTLQPLYQDTLNLQKIRGLQYHMSATNDNSLQVKIDLLQQKTHHLHESVYSAYPHMHKKYSDIHIKTKQALRLARLAERDPEKIFFNYSSLIFDHFIFLQNIAKESSLSLDSDAEISTLVEISIIRIPVITEIIGQLRGHAGVWLYNKEMNKHWPQINYMFESAKNELKLFNTIITSLPRYREIKNILDTSGISEALNNYYRQLQSARQSPYSKQQSNILFTKADHIIESIRLINQQVITLIEQRLETRTRKQQQKYIAAIISILLAILSMTYFIYLFYRKNQLAFSAEVMAREELAVSELRHRRIVDTMIDGLVIIDTDGIIQDFNPAAETLFGHKAQDIVGKNIKLLMSKPHQSEHDQYISTYMKTGKQNIIGINRELTALHKDGSLIPIELSVTEITLGNERLFSGIVRDISERMHVTKMKDEFISSVSHELRTPLTSIRGALRLINGGIVGKLPKQAMEMFQIAYSNTNNLLHLINDILDIQKVSSGHIAFKYNALEVMPFLQKVIHENALYGAENGIQFVIRESLPGAHVYADKVRLQEVLTNLFSNAAKFSGKSTLVEINVTQAENKIRISVTDHGNGIADEFKPQVFDRFTQSESSHKHKIKGSGLGLSIAKVIIEKHGGSIDFISKEGLGSMFYIELAEFKKDP